MAINRSLGGIGTFFQEDEVVGQVYYNIATKQPRGVIMCNIVFLDKDIILPQNEQLYKLFLEDGRYLFVTVSPNDPRYPSSYLCTAWDGKLHNDDSDSQL